MTIGLNLTEKSNAVRNKCIMFYPFIIINIQNVRDECKIGNRIGLKKLF